MNNPLGVSPSKGKQGTTRGKEKINTLRDLQNFSYPTKTEFNHCFIIHLKYFPVLKKEVRFAISFFVFPLTKYNTTLSPGFLG